MYFDKEFSLPTGYRFLLNSIIVFLGGIDGYCQGTGKLLDIGCGKKPYKKLIKKYEYVGMDYYSDVSNPDIFGTVTAIPFSDESLDACMTVWVLDDLEEPGKGIKEISRVLKPGGYYFAVESQSTNQHFPPHDFFRFAPAALEYLCKQNGMELVECRSFGGDFALVGLNLILIARRLLPALHLYRLLGWVCFLMINLVFWPLDWFFRRDIFKKKFESNSIGYCYVFKKIYDKRVNQKII